ncbi:hypothetical protein GCM10027592_57270 [Spirosoma flavus]
MHPNRMAEELTHQIDKYSQLLIGFERMLPSITIAQAGQPPSSIDLMLITIAHDQIAVYRKKIGELKLLREKSV